MKKGADGIANGFLDPGSHFKGDLTFEDSLRIDGKFDGTIRSPRELIISETAVVNAEIRVGTVSIDGTVRGSIVASEKIEIHGHGRVSASLRSPVLRIDEGAFFEGDCSTEGDVEDRG